MQRLNVNGTDHDIAAPDDMPLLWVLRDLIGLRGTKYGCGQGLCGACTIHVDGVATRSCITPVGSVQDRRITTIEGIDGSVANALQTAWLELNVPQCGYCQAGQIMTAAALLDANPSPDDAEIDVAMNGNLCRCGTYSRIRRAVRMAAGNHVE